MNELDTELLKIIGYFGLNNQQRKLQEEIFELQESIYEMENSTISDYEDKLGHFIEELSDVIVLLRQLQLEFGVSNEEIISEMKKKTSRTIDRMLEGYYKKG